MMTDQPDHLTQLHPAWRQAVTTFFLGEFKPDHVLTFDWLYENFAIERPTLQTPLGAAQKAELAFLGQFKNFEDCLLREHTVALSNVRGVGYRIVAPEQQSAWAERNGIAELRKAARKLGDRLVYVDIKRLSDPQRRENADALARFSMFTGMVENLTERHKKRLVIDGPADDAENG